jgi:hypothetical protein
MTEKLMVTAKEAADILSLSLTEVYALANSGVLVKAYIGKGTTAYRLTMESLRSYVASLPSERVPA